MKVMCMSVFACMCELCVCVCLTDSAPGDATMT